MTAVHTDTNPFSSLGPLMLKTYISFAASGNYSVSVFNGHHFLRLFFFFQTLFHRCQACLSVITLK